MDAFNDVYSALGLKLDAKKTQVLYQPRHELSNKEAPKVTITAGEEELESVDSFNYLRSTLSTKAIIDVEIDRRLQAAGTAIGKLQAPHTTLWL